MVGGEIVGADIALDTPHRGKKVGIVDRNDLAARTSSRSAKLPHGGVWYLSQMRFGLIHSGLKKQRILEEIASYLVNLVDFVIPLYRNHSFADSLKWALHFRIFPGGIRLGLWW